MPPDTSCKDTPHETRKGEGEHHMNRHVHLWLKEIRANFLVLPVVLVAIGGAAAKHADTFRPILLAFTLIGVVTAHISVNLFNEYSDWKTGIDAHTDRTPFSGGSGNLPDGFLDPRQVFAAAWGTLATAFVCGVWLALEAGWLVFVFMGIGGVVIVLYTDVLTKGMVGELFSGLALGSLVVIGTYFVQAGNISRSIVWASVPPGILTTLLLLLNEFPDAEADRTGGRKHMVIVLGKRISAIVYAVLMVCVYGILGLGVMCGVLPPTVLIGLLTLPVGLFIAYRVVRFYNRQDKLMPALGLNVAVVLGTDFMIAAGFLLA